MGAVKLTCAADCTKVEYLQPGTVFTSGGAQGDIGVPETERRHAEVLLRQHLDVLLEALLLSTTVERRMEADGNDMQAMPDAQTADAELTDLGLEVAAAAQSVASLRASVPQTVSGDLATCLQAYGPAPVTVEAPAASHGASAPGDAPALSPVPAALQGRMVTAVAKMSTLRARLDEALERLQRVIEAVAGEARRGPPCTVERALRGSVLRAPAGTAGEHPSPKLELAVGSGRIVTRRRAAKDLGQPLPFPLA